MNEPSILTILAAADTHDLTTLATVKDELRITDRASDATLRRWVREATGLIETECNRVFALEQVSEQWRSPVWCGGRDVTPLRLRRYPVVTIDSISEDDGAALTADDYEVDAERGFLWRIAGQVSGAGGARINWTAQKLLVTYTAGYALLGNLPYNLERACQALVTMRWNARGRDPALRAETVPGVLERQWWVPSVGQSALPPEIAELLEPFREVNV